MSLYDRYISCIEKHLNEEVLTFKSDPDYRYMLEHVYFQDALKYLKLILNHFSTDEIVQFTTLNDSIGMPQLSDFSGIIPPCSTTSLRYIYHSILILTYMKKIGIKHTSITEIGGGYGGLCAALHTYASKFDIHIDSYHIVDLDLPGKLQRRVLDTLGFKNVQYHSASSFGKDVPDGFLVSNYAFSEIEDVYQVQYVKTLFPKMHHGFLVWNCIPVYDFGKETIIEDENPLTGPDNKYVYF